MENYFTLAHSFMTPQAERAAAARNLAAILGENRTIDWAFDRRTQSSLSKELTYGVLRHFFSLCSEVDAKLSKSFRSKDLDIYGLLLVGAYQLKSTRIPTHAAIFETVAAVQDLRKPCGGCSQPTPLISQRDCFLT